jgi:hypothetical protein
MPLSKTIAKSSCNGFFKMEPSGFEPLTPCMPWSLFIGVNPLLRRDFASLLHYVLRQTVSQNLVLLSPEAVVSDSSE